MVRYEVETKILCSEELGEYVTYGIRACEGGVIVESVSDISTDHALVQKLVDRCNEGGLDTIHLSDFVTDCLV